jgi:hypothetical protein
MDRTTGIAVAMVIVFGLGIGLLVMSSPSGSPATSKSTSPAPTPFSSVLWPDGDNEGVVLVVAATNCGKEPAQRADRLARQLEQRGVTYRRVNTINISGREMSSQEEVDQFNKDVESMNAIMNGPLPIVFLNDRAKANPTLEEVLAEVENQSSAVPGF